jgi:hypothetical protein
VWNAVTSGERRERGGKVVQGCILSERVMKSEKKTSNKSVSESRSRSESKNEKKSESGSENKKGEAQSESAGRVDDARKR